MLASAAPESERPRFRWSLTEFSGAMGDLGVFIPIVVGLIAVNGMDSSQLLTTFGLFFIASGLAFGIPMPLEPMKAIAVTSIANSYTPHTVMLAGLLTGLMILAISLAGFLTHLNRLIPKAVVKGIQMGLAVSLAVKGLTMIGKTPILGFDSVGLAALSAALILLSFRSRFPVALALVIVGVAIAFVAQPKAVGSVGLSVWTPSITLPLRADFPVSLNLALAQLPLTLTNSLLATYGLLYSSYRERTPSIKAIGKGVGLISTVSPLIGGIGMCYGAGGVAAWRKFGARTGGSMLMFGGMLMLLGVFAGGFVAGVMQTFPTSILGVLLVFVAFELASQSRDVRRVGDVIVISVTAMVGFAYNMVAGVLLGLAAAYALKLMSRKVEGVEVERSAEEVL